MTDGEWFGEVAAWAAAQGWWLGVFVVICVTGLVDLTQRALLRRLQHKAQDTNNEFDDVLLAALVRPVTLIIWVLGLTYAGDLAQQSTEGDWFAHVELVRQLGVIVAIAWFLLRLVRGGEDRMITRVRTVSLSPDEGMDRSTVEAFGKLMRAAIMVTAALLLLQTLGYSISGVLAFGGVAGIAVGFAARDVLANFFGGIMVHMDRPLAVGEWVRSPDREIEGTVEYIGWRISRIRTFDMRPLYVPNSVFANILVENPSRMSHRRIYEIVGIRYQDIAALPTIVDEIRAYLEAHGQIDTEQPLIVNFVDYGASSLDIMIYCLVTEKRWVPYHALKQEVMMEIARIIDRNGAEIAYPTSTLHIASLRQPGGEPIDPGRRPAAEGRAS